MSVQAISAAFAIQGVTPTEKLLLLALSNYADPKMTCFPSHKTLAEDTGLNQRSILRLMEALEGKGLIFRKARFRSNKSRTTDIITLRLRGDTVSGGGGDTLSGGVGTLTTKGGDTVSPPEPRLTINRTSRTREPLELGSASANEEAEREASGKLFRELAASLAMNKPAPRTRRVA